MPSSIRRRPVDRALLDRMLEDPDLLPRIRALPAPLLRRTLLEIGLEDAGEIVALASLEQLREVFDEDLWTSPRPGADEAFDAVRFALWLEILLEGGDAFVANRLAELSEDFLAFAFSQLVRVIDTTAWTETLAGTQEAYVLDEVMDARLCQELDEYLIVSRLDNGWDAVWASLLALDERHAALLRTVLRRCWLTTWSRVERAGGLHAALDEAERVAEDARAERDDRRAERGYVSPADARAFLGLARSAPATPERDSVTRAYFRSLEPTGGGAARSRDARGERMTPATTSPALRLDAGAGRDARTWLPVQRATSAHDAFRQALAELLEADPDAHQRVVDELAYLANVLVAGDDTRAWSPADAAERVLALCDAGLAACLEARARAPEPPGAAQGALRRWGAVGLFRFAWAKEAAAR